jgi:hypothetical protein
MDASHLYEEQSHDPLLDRVAAQVVRRGLVTPAVFFLELHRPLSFLAGQATHALQPFLAPVFGYETVKRLARMLEDPANVDRLLDRIEQFEKEGLPPEAAASPVGPECLTSTRSEGTGT